MYNIKNINNQRHKKFYVEILNIIYHILNKINIINKNVIKSQIDSINLNIKILSRKLLILIIFSRQEEEAPP